MKEKTFKTYSEQLDSLVDDKGLVVRDRNAALETLRSISYFALISGYKVPFRDDSGRYKEGVTFDDIVALYDFDVALSNSYLGALFACERRLKTIYGYHFAREFGEKETDYLNEKNYHVTKETLPGVRKTLELLKGHARNEIEEHGYIEHYNKNYKNVPVWVLMHSVTFGELARMYGYAKPELLSVICTELPAMRAKHLPYVLEFLTRIRNNCAHTEPLYTLRTSEYLPCLGAHHSLGLAEADGSRCTSGQNDPFGALIAMRYILPKNRLDKLLGQIDAEFQKLAVRSSWIQQDGLLRIMGYPGNWKDVATTAL